MEPVDLIPGILRPVQAGFADLKHDLHEIKARLVIAESGIATLRRHGADDADSIGVQHLAHDRLTERIKRIEARLGILEAR